MRVVADVVGPFEPSPPVFAKRLMRILLYSPSDISPTACSGTPMVGASLGMHAQRSDRMTSCDLSRELVRYPREQESAMEPSNSNLTYWLLFPSQGAGSAFAVILRRMNDRQHMQIGRVQSCYWEWTSQYLITHEGRNLNHRKRTGLDQRPTFRSLYFNQRTDLAAARRRYDYGTRVPQLYLKEQLNEDFRTGAFNPCMPTESAASHLLYVS